ncbi:MAG: GtrA family protein [Chloroflexi bacterium]|nr:GtrA family protein [Chloroflexota bacterium]
MSENMGTMKMRRVAVRNPLDGPIVAIAGRFGSKSKEVERFLKFAIVGAIGAVIDFGTLVILQATVLQPIEPNANLKVVIASTIAFLAAVLSNFIWNRLWTYPDSRSRSVRKQLVQFTVISTVGWVGRTLWINASFMLLGGIFTPIVQSALEMIGENYVPTASAEAKIGTMVAWFIGVIVVMIWNFLANRYWTYSDVD